MATLPHILNGAILPNWVKLLVLGSVVGIAIGINQVSISALQNGQAEVKNELVGIRQDLRITLAQRGELDLLQQRIESNARRIEALEAELRMTRATR